MGSFLTAQANFVKHCRKVTRELSEECMEIEGEFLTIADMNERKFAKLLAYICASVRLSPKFLTAFFM